MMMGRLTTMVIVERMDVGVTVFAPALALLANTSATVCDVCVFVFCKIFINSYCSVLRFSFDELYKKTSNQEFH
ncbi:hypothetical protein D3C86_2042520 [compost metagenome]